MFVNRKQFIAPNIRLAGPEPLSGVSVFSRIILLALLSFSVIGLSSAAAQPDNGELPEVLEGDAPSADAPPDSEDVEELIRQAEGLFRAEHPIDARAKLQKALKLAPEDYRPHLMLGAYYLSEVGHFRLAFRYITAAEKLFEKKYGEDVDSRTDSTAWREQARILYLLSEAHLNLDDYQGALSVLDRFEKKYWDDWYPGTRAWVLMKLKRVDEAIRVAQAGLLRGAEPARTYNILGILLSLKGNRNLSLEAFGRAIRVESALGSLGQVATPLNNAGEVYREQFRDDLAEAAWVKAVKLPDGCDHILPSLNLSILLLDQLRLFESSRVLDDFEACYAQHSQRQDTEHRALIALGRGRIALHSGDVWSATSLLRRANEKQQWFGKIGTNENDLRFAGTIAWADVLEAQIAVLRDRSTPRWIEQMALKGLLYTLRGRVAWFRERARKIALGELADFEDLYFRNTDSMLEYPTLGRILSGIPTRSLSSRVARLKKRDQRYDAGTHYDLFVAENELEQGALADAKKHLRQVLKQLRPIDRLAQAETLIKLIKALESDDSWWSPLSKAEAEELVRLKEQLFELNPPEIRIADLALPVSLVLESDNYSNKKIAQEIADELSIRFPAASASQAGIVRNVLKISVKGGSNAKPPQAEAELSRRASGQLIARVNRGMKDNWDISAVANNVIAKAFRHKVDPAGAPASESELFEGLSLNR